MSLPVLDGQFFLFLILLAPNGLGMEEIKLKFYLAGNLRIKSVSDTPQHSQSLHHWRLNRVIDWEWLLFLRLATWINRRYFCTISESQTPQMFGLWIVDSGVRCVKRPRAALCEDSQPMRGLKSELLTNEKQRNCVTLSQNWQDNYHPDSTQTWKIREFCFKCQDQVSGACTHIVGRAQVL